MAGKAHTQFAMRAIDLAGIFNSVVGTTAVASTEGESFKPELATPDGPSTGGGAQSVQHIKLTRTGLVVTAGAADQVERTVELRSFDYMSNMHAQRFHGAALPIDRAAYEEFVKRARDLFSAQGFTVVLKDATPMAPAPQQSSGGSSIAYVIVGLIIAIAVGGAAYFFVMK